MNIRFRHMAETRQRDWKSLAIVLGAIGIVLLQIPMAYIGTELGWANGVEVGIQTYKTGKIVGVGLGIVFAIFAVTTGLKWYQRRPVPALIALIVLGGMLSGVTVLFTMLRAAASFFLYLEP